MALDSWWVTPGVYPARCACSGKVKTRQNANVSNARVERFNRESVWIWRMTALFLDGEGGGTYLSLWRGVWPSAQGAPEDGVISDMKTIARRPIHRENFWTPFNERRLDATRRSRRIAWSCEKRRCLRKCPASAT